VRNTFIQALVSRSEYLEAFLQERRVQSCPNTARVAEADEASTEPPTRSEVISLADELFGHSNCSETLTANPEVSAAMPQGAPPFDWNAFVQQVECTALARAVDSAPGQGAAPGMQGIPPPPPAQWAPTAFDFGVPKPPPLPSGELGSDDMPTVGSLLHRGGHCEPCGFFHTKGCVNGARCAFCHLCSPGEVKRRRKEKMMKLREEREAALAAAEKEVETLEIAEPNSLLDKLRTLGELA